MLKSEFSNLKGKLAFSKILFLKEKLELSQDLEDVIELLKKIFAVENYRRDFKFLFMRVINQKYFQKDPQESEPSFPSGILHTWLISAKKSLFVSKAASKKSKFKKQIRGNKLLSQLLLL